MKTAEYLKINPFGKVPTLVDGDVVVYELAAICAYLADKYIEKGLAPAFNDPKRGVYYRWLFMISGPWDGANTDRYLNINVSAEQKIHVGYGDYDDIYQALISGLEQVNPYLCGEQFTAADIYVGALLMWQLKMGDIANHPAIERYISFIKQRPILQENTFIFSN